MVLHHMVERANEPCRNGFPDALDLLVVCVESGLGLAAAIQRVADELEVSHPELATELALVNAEIRVGVAREQALKNFADRTGLEDIRGLVGLLVQTMRFGTGMADALRVYSDEFRDKRDAEGRGTGCQDGHEDRCSRSFSACFPCSSSWRSARRCCGSSTRLRISEVLPRAVGDWRSKNVEERDCADGGCC